MRFKDSDPTPRKAQANLGGRGKPLGVPWALADFPRLLLS